MRPESVLVVCAMAVALALSGCSGNQADSSETTPRVLKVAVSAEGEITLDGSVVTLSHLREELAAVRGTDASVWYYRATPSGDPPENAMQVIKAIVDNRLPVSLSTEPDFSTVVMPDGSVKPRQ